MTNLELKRTLIRKIAEINDEDFLNALKTIIDLKSEPFIYKTTLEQRKRIQQSQEQIAKGEFFTDEQVESEINKWLKEK